MAFFKKLLGGGKKTETSEPPQVTEAVEQQASQEEGQPEKKASLSVSAKQLILGVQTTDKTEILQLIADNFVTLGFVEGDYLQALLDREAKVSTFLINGVAIPHGVNEAKDQVKSTGVVIVQVPAGISWNDKGDVARLIVGIAAKGKDHLELLQRLTTVVMDEELAASLAVTTEKKDILDALNEEGYTEAESAEDYAVSAEVEVVDPQGMHARPASILAECAARFTETDIRIRNGERSASAKSMASLLAMGAGLGDLLVVSGQGAEAEKAVNTLVEMIGRGLDEEEEQEHADYNPLTVLTAMENVGCRMTISGSAASPGITMAPAYRLHADKIKYEENGQDKEEENKLFRSALSGAAQQLDELIANLQTSAPNEAAILQAQKGLLQDELIVKDSKGFIEGGKTAAWAFHQAVETQIASLQTVENERIKARIADLVDVRNRVLALMVSAVATTEFPQTEFILLAKELTPSQTAGLHGLKVCGICTELGGPNSHMAILARALGIPAVVGLGDGVLDNVINDELIIVDPQASSIYIGPDETAQKLGREKIAHWEEIRKEEDSQKHKVAETKDGHHIDVVCNIAKPEDAGLVLDHGGEGVGLLRTEFLFESSTAEPSVAEQFESLKGIADQLGSRQLIVRTIDIGGDKPVSWLHIPHEDNPFLGMRGIRLSFKHEEVFRRQLEAIYKTAMYQSEKEGATGLHIMFPMIGRMSEWERASEMAGSVRQQLGAPKLPLGIMIEVPSAVMIAKELAKEVDFFSIGSNDLTQYTLAIDRGHPDLCCEADSYHPALVRMIKMTVEGARAHGKWVGVCGNAAANPNLAALLVGLGVTELSVSPTNVAAVKNLIRAVGYTKLQEKAEKALKLESSEAIMQLYKNNEDLL